MVASACSEFPPPATQQTVLVVDDERTARAGLVRLLTADGFRCLEAWSTDTTLASVARDAPSMVLLDIDLGGDDGLEVLALLASLAPDLPVIMVTGNDEPELMDRAFEKGASGYVVKPFRRVDLRAALLSAYARRHSQHGEQAARARLETDLRSIEGQFAARFLLTSWFHHTETGAHAARIGAFSEVLARAVGVPDERARMIGVAATLHDIGKIGIPEAILRKPGRLDEAEFRRVQEHTTIGARILSGTDVPLLVLAAEIALSHHERWDGNGYPERRVGARTPLEARIVAVADVYDALAHERVYKKAWPEARVLEYFDGQRDRQFEGTLVSALLRSADALRDIREGMPDDGTEPRSYPPQVRA